MTGEYTAGLLLCAAAFAAGTAALLELGARWSRTWERGAARQAGVFSYRPIAGGGSEKGVA